ncbi:MAG: threonine 3-dehydrogenase [Halanaerobiales bacterium]|nr:threonine 3-dehydrogenase [Halanaerobiales bacterium]
MKAAYKPNRNKGIEIREIPVPEISSNEILIKVKAGAVCGSDIHLYNWSDWCENVDAKNPMVIGHEFCGEVVAVGEQVSSIKKGDLIAAETHIPCGECRLCKTGKQHICQDMKIVGVHTDGAFAEYAKIPEVCAWKLPEGTPPEIGAVYEPFGIAVHGVLKDKIAGFSTVIIGAGPIGLFAANVASVSGASQVFVVDLSEYRLNLASKMGDNIVTLNPTQDDVVKIIKEKTGGFGADVVIELSGSVSGTKTGLEVLRKGGRVSLIGLHSQEVPLDLVNNVIYKEATIYGITGREMFDSWYLADSLIQSGKLNIRDILTHEFSLDETEKAILTAKGGKAGKVIIKI